MMPAESSSLGAELRRLEQIVRALEDPEMDLDEALKLFEEGIARLRAARDRLTEADLTVKRVLEEADGTIRARDLDG
jgi:exodeoxyribonuclease VII small subunit